MSKPPHIHPAAEEWNRRKPRPVRDIMVVGAHIYKRNNGDYGASCDGVADTGHTIIEEDGKFTVWSDEDPDHAIAYEVPQGEAEAAIAHDWRRAQR